MLRLSFHPRTFVFGFDARTSRGAMKDKKSWFIKIRNENEPDIFGVGECGPLPGLSPEEFLAMEPMLNDFAEKFNKANFSIRDVFAEGNPLEPIRHFLESRLGTGVVHANSSLVFAFETAALDLLHLGRRIIFDNSFIKGTPIAINGLVWMGGLDFMLQQADSKIKEGFNCIKLKVGGLNFEQETDIVRYIRQKYFRENVTVRLDANGAFRPENALQKIEQLAKFGIHSIEQPLKPGRPELAELCMQSPVPIALDEELIGIHQRAEKEQLLDRIKPAYLILKPTLHGGMFGSAEWIELAGERGIGWWITSALESNVGLNAVSQFAAQYQLQTHQGLGTGSIYTNNIRSPLKVKEGHLSYNSTDSWQKPLF